MSRINDRVERLDEAQWRQFEQQGSLVLKGLLPPDRVEALQNRIDQIMLGKARVDYSRMLMQLDSESGTYEDAGAQSKGHKGPTLNYRKIQDLEYDACFLELMRHPVLHDACRRIHGQEADIACFRAMFMNKPANRGTFLPWHQDRWNYLDRDPELTVWIPLDSATVHNGCVQYVPRSHKAGLINPEHSSGFLTEQQAQKWAPKDKVRFLELEPGDVALLHNRLLHASDVNRSQQSRRAFSVCYMDARTRHTDGRNVAYPIIFGKTAIAPQW